MGNDLELIERPLDEGVDRPAELGRHEARAIEEQARNRAEPIGRHEAAAIAKHMQMVEHQETAARLLHAAQEAIARALMATGQYSAELDAEVAANERKLAVASSAAAMAAEATIKARKRDRDEAHAARTEKLMEALRERESIAAEIQKLGGQLALQVEAMEKSNGRLVAIVGLRRSVLTSGGHWTSEAMRSAMERGEVAKRSTAAAFAGHLIERQYQRESAEVLQFHELLFQHGGTDAPDPLPQD